MIMRLKVDFKSSKLIVMTIGDVERESGVAASAIRFYEQAGVLPKPVRMSGRRHYDASILERLAVLDRARACGFSLAEIRQLFYGFREGAPPSERWRTLARRKIAELDEMMRKISTMKRLLECSCTCKDFAECGRRILAGRRG
jgi:MerR family transcriptional regulator, redox-sensitive transcriptional activator SoxR